MGADTRSESMAEREAATLFADGWGVTSRKYRMISRCPPDTDLAALVKARTLPPLPDHDDLRDFYRRVVSKESRTVSRAVMDALNALHGRGMSATATAVSQAKAAAQPKPAERKKWSGRRKSNKT